MKTIENLKFYKKELIIGPIFKLFEAIIEVTLPFLMAKLINNIGTWNSKEIIYYGIGMLFLTIIAVFLQVLVSIWLQKLHKDMEQK